MEECIKKVQVCPVCQQFTKRETRPATFYTSINNAIPFVRWGIEILGPLPREADNAKFCIVEVDYFTKWAETAPFATIIEQQCRRFIWKQIVCRFGLPEHLVTDNAK